MINSKRISYILLALTLVLVAWLHLGALLLAVLFSIFVLNKLYFTKSKGVAVALFLIVIIGVTYVATHFTKAAVVALPQIADTSIPPVLTWAEAHHFELPFTDYASLKELALETVKEQGRALSNIARGATSVLVFVLIGIVVAISMFLNSQLDLDRASHRVKGNLYSLCCEEIALRFHALYQSFATVMGAQIVISVINTVISAIFIVFIRLPYAPVVIGVTFLCGMVPIIGNLISNTIIVCLAFTVSPKLALAALIFLIVVHKLEYFLNSKIVGDRIRNPVWLTLIGLIIGEKLMGLPGMILAPVVLNYIRLEASQIEVLPAQKKP